MNEVERVEPAWVYRTVCISVTLAWLAAPVADLLGAAWQVCLGFFLLGLALLGVAYRLRGPFDETYRRADFLLAAVGVFSVPSLVAWCVAGMSVQSTDAEQAALAANFLMTFGTLGIGMVLNERRKEKERRRKAAELAARPFPNLPRNIQTLLGVGLTGVDVARLTGSNTAMVQEWIDGKREPEVWQAVAVAETADTIRTLQAAGLEEGQIMRWLTGKEEPRGISQLEKTFRFPGSMRAAAIELVCREGDPARL